MRSLAVVLAALAMAPLAAGGKIAAARIAWVQHGVLTHPGNKGTWTMAGAIVDKGTFVASASSARGRRQISA